MRSRKTLTFRVVLLAAVLVMSSASTSAARESPAAPAQVDAAWLQFGPQGSLLARAVTGAGACPPARLGTRTVSMTERAAPGPSFPVRSCEAVVPPGVRRVVVAGHHLTVPGGPPRRIAVLGDTGCRLKAVDGFQACNDPQQWPFSQVAQSLARYDPDLVIHVGDYLYREQPCPPATPGCAGSPWGPNWQTWAADFFTPAAPALRAAPWVFVRGDHESCARAGEGWFRFLEPRPTVSCTDRTEPYSIPVGGLQLLVMDTVRADDTNPSPPVVQDFAQQFSDLAGEAGDTAWLLSHRPMWGLVPGAAPADLADLQVFNATLQQASGNVLPRGVQLVLTGHIHLAEVLTFEGNRPPQMVAGIGGTLLLPEIDQELVGRDVAGAVLAAATIRSGHGFITFERRSSGWAATIRDVSGRPQHAGHCRLEDKEAACS
jgi:hypothetical protein